MATPLSGNADPGPLLASAVDLLAPDVLGVQEVDYFLDRSGNENQVAKIARLLGTPHWAFAPSLIGSPDEDWRGLNNSDSKVVTEISNGSPGYGIGLISKIPVIAWHRLELRAAPIGVFMTLPRDGKLQRIYVRDHPRVAIGAVLENGWLIVNTHLSFVPFFNYLQLVNIKRWIRKLPVKDKSKIIIMGDLNLPYGILVRGLNWNSLAKQLTFPSWKPKVQIDYILSQKISSEDVLHLESTNTGLSDHLSLSVDVD